MILDTMSTHGGYSPIVKGVILKVWILEHDVFPLKSERRRSRLGPLPSAHLAPLMRVWVGQCPTAPAPRTSLLGATDGARGGLGPQA
jgi:hypothetical protein